jgi:hypothetical protein
MSCGPCASASIDCREPTCTDSGATLYTCAHGNSKPLPIIKSSNRHLRHTQHSTLKQQQLAYIKTSELRPTNRYPATATYTMSNPAAKRLFKEYKALSSDPPEGITAGPVTEDDMFLWEALIQGPEGTPFEGGIFPAELKFPKDYPLAPPKMKFLTEVWHPNGKLISSQSV